MNHCEIGDCRDIMRRWIAEGVKVQMCVTSPPFWGLRDYGTATWEGGDPACEHNARTGDLRFTHPISDKQKSNAGSAGSAGSAGDFCVKCGAQRFDKQLGLESTPQEYVENMVDVFRLVRELLADDGTLWLNLGDSYASITTGTNCQASSTLQGGKNNQVAGCNRPNKIIAGLKAKDLVGIPWRVAFALQQPYYTGKVKDERDRVWLAAMLDAEGCIFIHKRKAGQSNGQGYERQNDNYAPGVEISNTHLAVIERIALLAGNGSVCKQEGGRFGRKQTLYRWNLRTTECKEFLRELYPHLIAKQQQARIAFNCPSSGERADAAHQALIGLHRGSLTDVDFAEPPSCLSPGWYLRQDIIWKKPNPMPESVRDRCTKSHEYLFLLSKNERYYYNADAIAEPVSPAMLMQIEQGYNRTATKDYAAAGAQDPSATKSRIVNGKRASWRGSDFDSGKTGEMMETRGHKQRKPAGWATGVGAHGSFHREGRAQEIEYTDATKLKRNKRSVWTFTTQPYADAHFATFPPALIEPCILAGSKSGDVVLDPFMGSGTTGEVAQNLGRRWVGCELNADYKKLQDKRTAQQAMIL